MCDLFPFKTLISVRCHDHVFKLNFLIVSKVTTLIVSGESERMLYVILGRFPFVRTGQTILVITRISLLIKTIQSDPK